VTSPGLRAADLRLALPRAPGVVTVLGGLPGWAGVGLDPGAPLTVADRQHRRAAVARDGELLLEGAAPGRLAGRTPARWLVLPGPVGPRLVVPAGRPLAARAALCRVVPSGRLRTRIRDVLAPALVGRGALPPHLTWTVASGEPGPPWPARAAEALGVRPGPDWYLWLGQGDVLQRAALHVLRADGSGWVVKLARVPDYAAPFVRDEAAAALVRAAGPVTASNAPDFLGRSSACGLHYCVERRAPGRPLGELLAASRPDDERTSRVEAVCQWLVAMAVETRQPPESTGPELDRLRRDVLPLWPGIDPAGLLAAVAGVPGVLAHHDLGSWNIAADAHGFCVLDWESAAQPALPLWDLAYFLGDALVRCVGADGPDRGRATLELFAGGSPWSPVLFRWVRTMVRALGLAPTTVGPLVTLGWLHHARSPQLRDAALDRTGGEPAATPGTLVHLARPWLADPRLGPTWSAWQ